MGSVPLSPVSRTPAAGSLAEKGAGRGRLAVRLVEPVRSGPSSPGSGPSSPGWSSRSLTVVWVLSFLTVPVLECQTFQSLEWLLLAHWDIPARLCMFFL